MAKPREMKVTLRGFVKDEKKEIKEPEKRIFKNVNGYLEYEAQYSVFYDFKQEHNEILKNEIDNIFKNYKSILSIKFQTV